MRQRLSRTRCRPFAPTCDHTSIRPMRSLIIYPRRRGPGWTRFFRGSRQCGGKRSLAQPQGSVVQAHGTRLRDLAYLSRNGVTSLTALAPQCCSIVPRVLGYKRGGRYDLVAFHLLPVLRLWVRDVFSAVDHCPGPQQARPASDLPAQSVPGMERHWMDRRAGLGGKERRSRSGEVTSACDRQVSSIVVDSVVWVHFGWVFAGEGRATTRP